MTESFSNAAPAAAWLMGQHAEGCAFTPLSGTLRPASMDQAYQVQDALVALRIKAWGSAVAGYKIALTTPAMREFVGYGDSIAGQVLARRVMHTPAKVRLADAGRLGYECELAFLLGEELPLEREAPDRARVSQAIAAVAPAFELVDDRNADYAIFAGDAGAALSLAADNAWNHGVVLGAWRQDWAAIDLANVHGVLQINGTQAGEGWGRDVLGHPLDAMVWLARHLHARGLTLKKGQLVITGSLITSKFPRPGDRVRFAAAGVGEVELAVEA